jgi:pyroglutamyl-peptidase
MNSILVTGFGPFDGIEENPSATLATLLGRSADVEAEVLPVAWNRLDDFVSTTLAVRWRAVVMLGVAPDREYISLERVAVNLCDPKRKDATDAVAPSMRLVDGAPDAYFSTLPIHALEATLVRAGFPVARSPSAGTYLCNALFYRARHALADRGTPCGFVHVPPTPGSVEGQEGVSIEVQITVLQALLEILRLELPP